MKASLKRKISLYVTILATIGLFCGSFIWIFFIASHEKFRVISSPTPVPTVVPEISWIVYTNNYFTLSYPSSAKEESGQKDTNPAVVASWVIHQSNPSMQFASEVLREPDMAAVTDFPSVAFRHLKSAIYTQSPILVNGMPGIQFSRHPDSDNPAEFGAFFFKNHMIYTFVVQAKDEVYAEQTYHRILSTLVFAK